MSEQEPQVPDDPQYERIRKLVMEESERRKLTRAELGRSAGVPSSTTTQWLNGTYPSNTANITNEFVKWLQSLDDNVRTAALTGRAPDFLETPTSRQVLNALAYAQSSPEMVPITLGSGMGKTFVCEYFAKGRPHVTMVTMRPETSTVSRMLYEIAAELKITAPRRELDRVIGSRLQRNGRHTLLIVDEAQHLQNECVNQLRYWLDRFGCGIALVGNEAIFARFVTTSPDGYGQIHRRLGMRVHELKANPDDIAMFIAGWGIVDPEQIRLLTAIGNKPGALGQIDKTIKLASILASNQKRAMSAADIRAAWQNRGGEVMR